jgi:hypothetical protein
VARVEGPAQALTNQIIRQNIQLSRNKTSNLKTRIQASWLPCPPG